MEALKSEIKAQNKLNAFNHQTNISLLSENQSNNQDQDDLGTIREENSTLKDRSQQNNSEIIRKVKGNKVNDSKLHIMSHFNDPNKTKVSFNDIPNDIIIKHIMFFLDLNNLPKLSLVNKKSNDCVKTHMIVRVFFLSKEKQVIEEENEEMIKEIEEKRITFFEEYEVNPPNKDNALKNIQVLTNNVSSCSKFKFSHNRIIILFYYYFLFLCIYLSGYY